jgi:dephospho-CoA kinase
VARLFKERGAEVIDADLLAREVVEPGKPAYEDIRARWPDVVRADGTLDRKALGAKVYADESQRQLLNGITHPRIQEATLARTQALAEAGAPAVLYEAALIVENNLDAAMDGLVVVSVPEDLQLQRLIGREGLSETDARRRLAVQAPLQEKLARATWVIDNSGDLPATTAQVERVWAAILAGEGKR